MFFFRKIFKFILYLIEKIKRVKIKNQCVLCGCVNECTCSKSSNNDDNISIKSDEISIKSDEISIKSNDKSIL